MLCSHPNPPLKEVYSGFRPASVVLFLSEHPSLSPLSDSGLFMNFTLFSHGSLTLQTSADIEGEQLSELIVS